MGSDSLVLPVSTNHLVSADSAVKVIVSAGCAVVAAVYLGEED